MAKDQAVERADFARELIEAGLPDPAVVRRLMARFNVVRSTAYLDIQKASDDITMDDDGPSDEQIHAPDVSGKIAALLYDAERCQEDGDYVSMARCIKSADLLRRWGGMAATL